jgi:predicted XRE-type DNA-binding protein
VSDLLENLKSEFQDTEYRYAYAESFLNTKLAAQIKTLREQRGRTQVQVAETMGIKQPGYRRFEDVNHSVWKTDSLWSIAKAHGVRLCISFESFGSIIEEKLNFKKEGLQRPAFEDDPVFKDGAKSTVASIRTDGALIVPIDSHLDYRGSRRVNSQTQKSTNLQTQPTGAGASDIPSMTIPRSVIERPKIPLPEKRGDEEKKIKVRVSATQTRYSPLTHRRASNG